MPSSWVSCPGDLPGGAIAHLREAGIYRSAAADDRGAGPPGSVRHYLLIEARDPRDALLIASAALAVAGAETDGLFVGDPPPDRPETD
jgi:hypothetical protein